MMILSNNFLSIIGFIEQNGYVLLLFDHLYDAYYYERMADESVSYYSIAKSIASRFEVKASFSTSDDEVELKWVHSRGNLLLASLGNHT
jgi:hypothetical protein